MNSGLTFQGNETSIRLRKSNKSLTFAVKIYTTNGTLFEIRIDERHKSTRIIESKSEPNTKMTLFEAH
jgi:hypothetical protein